MLKPSGLIMLIIALLGIGYFLQGGGCDGSVLLGDSGPDIPPTPDKSWLDTGRGWIDFESQEILSAICPEFVVGYCTPEKTHEYVPVQLVGNEIRYGHRFSPTAPTAAQKDLVREAVALSKVYPLVATKQLVVTKQRWYSPDADVYEIDETRATYISATKSDLREEKDYCYAVFEDLPSSPTNLYVFFLGGTLPVLIESN